MILAWFVGSNRVAVMDSRALFAGHTRALIVIGTLLAVAVMLLAGCSTGGNTTTQSLSSNAGQDSTTTPGMASTTALPPSPVADFNTFAQGFERLITERGLEGTLPFSIIPAEELAWLPEAANPLTVTDVKGYRLANGDSVILFSTEPDFFTATMEVQREAFPAATESISAAMEENFRGSHVLMSEPILGYLIAISSQWEEAYYYELQNLAGEARHLLPPEE
jgi:hypothetical protein